MAAEEFLARELAVLGLSLPSEQKIKLDRYLVELERWGRKLNLTALDANMRVRRLVAEPMWIARELGISGILVDVGSGNGSPALPICVTRAVTASVWVESRLKRAAFLRHLVTTLEISGVEVRRSRFEDAVFQPKPDWITFQAVALSLDLMEALRRASSSKTRIVWITAHGKAPKSEAFVIKVPDSVTEAWVFRI